MQIKTYPLSTLKEDLDELIDSKPTPEALDEYLLKQMDNAEWDQIRVVDKPGSIRGDTPYEKIYIVAGNYDEFEQYARKKFHEWRHRSPTIRQNPTLQPEYVYVKDRYTLMGLTNIKGYYIGTAFQRKDINQIKQAIAYVKERANLLEPIKYTFAELFR
jgi:hypothetical protein